MLRKIAKRNISIRIEEFKDILSLMSNYSVNEGHFIDKFEDFFKKYINSKEAIAVSSGRFALGLILKNLGIKKGDKIITSAYNFWGIPQFLLKEGISPVFIDADCENCQIDIKKTEERIDKNTKAIIVTHLFGQLCDLDSILSIARKYNLFVIEDAAHSLGSYYHGKHTGTIGDAGFFSLTGSKMLNTSFGGIIVTDNKELAKRIREELLTYSFPNTFTLIKERFITYIYALVTNRTFYSIIGWPIALLMSLFNLDLLEIYKKKRKSEIAEGKMRFTNLQALIGLNQMPLLNSLIENRKRIARVLINNLDPCISIQKSPVNCDPNYFMIAIRARNKMKVFKRLLLKGIDTNLSYVTDCSSLVANCNNPVSRFLSDSILTIHLPFDLKTKEILYIAKILNEIRDRLY